MGTPPGEITRLLSQVALGDRSAEGRLMNLVYGDLRRVAARLLRSERSGHSLQPTALVHEAYLRLVQGAPMNWENRAHFFAIAARKMRQVLVDHARSVNAAKRRGIRISLEDACVYSDEDSSAVLVLDEALSKLEEWDPRQCRIVEMRYFGGLTEGEIGAVLGVSERTVKRDWKMARAWLQNELSKSNEDRAATSTSDAS